MSDYQLMFVQHWLDLKREKERRSLGELLGVYWTADRYRKMSASSDGEPEEGHRNSEVMLPLAALLAPDVLHKTLDRTLKTLNPDSTTMTDFGPATFLGQLPIKEYMEMTSGVKPEVVASAITESNQPAPTGMKVDLEKLKRLDPELAAHFDPDYRM